MKKTLFVPLLLLVGGAYAQRISSDADTLAHQKLLTVANINREQSYLTFGNLRPLITEAKLSAGYLVTTQNRPWALMFNPQIQFRMATLFLSARSKPTLRYIPLFRFDGIPANSRSGTVFTAYFSPTASPTSAPHPNSREGRAAGPNAPVSTYRPGGFSAICTKPKAGKSVSDLS